MKTEKVIEILNSANDIGYGVILEGDTGEIKEALDIAKQAVETGDVYLSGNDINLYLEGYKEGLADYKGIVKENEKLKNTVKCTLVSWGAQGILVDEVLKAIDNAPTVPLPDFKEGYKQAILDGKTNYVRPKGEWINHRNDNGHNIADCSRCGKTMQWHDEDEDGVPRFCWFCGAKIDGVEAENGA